MLWNRKALWRLSSVIRAMRLPSLREFNAVYCCLRLPWFLPRLIHEYDCVNGACFAVFLFAAAYCCTLFVMTSAGATVPSCRWLWHPTHVTHLSLFHGINGTPSGRLPSVLDFLIDCCRDIGLWNGAPNEVVNSCCGDRRKHFTHIIWQKCPPHLNNLLTLPSENETSHFISLRVAKKTLHRPFLSHCKYSENSMTKLQENWWTSAILYAEHSH